MKAVGYSKSLPIADPQSLQDVELPKPTADGRDILVRVEAISVNPVDTKVRRRQEPVDGEVAVLGWDVAGVVEAVGDGVEMFRAGDEVWYAGAIDRPGCNSEFHLVDERIAARKPTSLSFPEAAALPLTAITAWEMLFDRLQTSPETNGGILVIGAGGGVGSILIQLAKLCTGLTIIGTASREETRDWAVSLGADHMVNHHEPLAPQLRAIGVPVDYIASLTHTDSYLNQYAEIIAPQGKIAIIDDPPALDILPFKRKSVSWHWEFMFARSMYQTNDMVKQHELLAKVAEMVDAGDIKTTVAASFGKINAENLREAHKLIESGKARGKLVLEGF